MTDDSKFIEHPFDNPDYINESLLKFKAANWDGKVFQDLINEYRNIFKTLPTYPIKVPKGTILFRGRPNDETGLFMELKQISIKPKELVTSYGRANIPNQAVFYCSTNEETVVREVTQWYINDNGRAQDLITKKVIGMNWSPFTSMMTISAWVVKEDLYVTVLFNGDAQRRSLAIQEYEKDRKNIINGGNANRLKSRNSILDFFSQEFGKLDVKHEFEYFYSAFYAYEVYNSEIIEDPSSKLDGVKFASIANDLRGENYALSEEAFKNKIDFLGANFCYTYNNNVGKIENEGTAMIGRVNAAILKDDLTFEWTDSTNDFDYIVKTGSEYKLLVLQPSGSRFPKAVVRING